MTNIRTGGMKEYLKDSAKEQDRLRRMLGGLLRPRFGLPQPQTGITIDPARTNQLARYGSRLIVWNFSLLSNHAVGAGETIAILPVGFRPPGTTLGNAWSNVDTNSTPCLVYVTAAGEVVFASASTPSSVGGTIEFTAAPVG